MPKIKSISSYNGVSWSAAVPLGANDVNVDITDNTSNPTDPSGSSAYLKPMEHLADSDVTVSAGDTDADAWTKFNRFRYRVARTMDRIEGSILYPTGDTTDRLAEINSRLNTYGHCEFVEGVYYISAEITLQENQSLRGCGKKSIIRKTSGAGDIVYVSVINNTQNVTIQDLSFYGSLTAKPTSQRSSGEVGISVRDHAGRVTINNCYFYGFSLCGVYWGSGYHWLTSLNVSNCTFLYCNFGFDSGQYGEYATIANCTMTSCYIGALVTGGNNKFVNCGFEGNNTGFALYDVATNGTNDGHASCIGCSFNHNDTYAITITNIDNGYVFEGCNIFYGDISITNSQGIIFSSCILVGNKDASLHTNVIVNSCPGLVEFLNCVCVYPPIWTNSNSSYFIRKNCRLITGTVIANDVPIETLLDENVSMTTSMSYTGKSFTIDHTKLVRITADYTNSLPKAIGLKLTNSSAQYAEYFTNYLFAAANESSGNGGLSASGILTPGTYYFWASASAAASNHVTIKAVDI